MLIERLITIPGLSERFEILPKSQVRADLRALRSLLADLDARSHGEVRHFDGRDADLQAMSHWLAAQDLDNEPAIVYWPYDHEAAIMNINDFIKNFDDLWYPSADDVIVLPDSGTHVLFIDHEEYMNLYEL